MFTLKIKWISMSENGLDVEDSSDLFIQADEVQVHGPMKFIEDMSAWPEGSYFDYTNRQGQHPAAGKLVQVKRNGEHSWYLCSAAWLLGPDGKTIENLTAS